MTKFLNDGGPDEDAGTIVATFNQLRADGHVAEALAFLDPACVYRLHLEQGTMPDVLPAFGVAAVSAALQRRDQAFVWEEHATLMAADSVAATGEAGARSTVTVRQRLDYRLRDRETGEIYEGTGRRVYVVEGDLITRIEEFHDAPRLAAFVRYCAWLLNRREYNGRRGL